MSKPKRTAESYLQSARKLAKFAPALKRYRRRKTLTRWEKGAITRKEKLLLFHTENLIPVTKKHARELKEQLFAPGIRAIELRNTAPDAKIRKVKQDLMVTSNGRTWLYWKLDREDVKTKRGMNKAAKAAFDMQFPIERVAQLAGIAFERLKPLAVHLWAPSGRVGRPFESLKQFSMWLAENWNEDRYTQQEKWVNGIVILVDDPNWRKTISVLKPSKMKYTCAAHPRVIRDVPGKCPFCNRTLIMKNE